MSGTGNVNGQTPTGTFNALIDSCHFEPNPATPGCFTPLGPIKLTVDVAGQNYRFDQFGPIPYALVGMSMGKQFLSLQSGIDNNNAMSSITLMGLSGVSRTSLNRARNSRKYCSR